MRSAVMRSYFRVSEWITQLRVYVENYVERNDSLYYGNLKVEYYIHVIFFISFMVWKA